MISVVVLQGRSLRSGLGHSSIAASDLRRLKRTAGVGDFLSHYCTFAVLCGFFGGCTLRCSYFLLERELVGWLVGWLEEFLSNCGLIRRARRLRAFRHVGIPVVGDRNNCRYHGG